MLNDLDFGSDHRTVFRISNCKARSGENINGNTKSNVAGNRFLMTLESQYGTIKCEVIHCSCARIQTTWFGVCLQPCCVAIVVSGPASETNDCISRWRFSNFIGRKKSETSPTRKAQLSTTILKKIRRKFREQGAWRIQCVMENFSAWIIYILSNLSCSVPTFAEPICKLPWRHFCVRHWFRFAHIGAIVGRDCGERF